jgi:hypothetical protein
LAAIVSTNSNATDPSVTFANMLWYDTANKQIKKRNEANSAWITLGTVDEANSKFTPNAAITTSEIAAATLVTSTDTSASRDTDTTIPTRSAVKTYADSVGITKTTGSAPYYGCRAFVFIADGANASTTWTGQNIASVTRNGTGLYTVTFTTAMPDANYCVSMGPNSQSNANNGFGMSFGFTAKSASSFQIRTRRTTDHTIFECAQMCLAVFA